MWEYYLSGCEVSFRYHNLAVFQIQLAKQVDAAPLTRAYLYSSEASQAL
jgi:cyclopropane-fatty-acyl-phospholipid synthase